MRLKELFKVNPDIKVLYGKYNQMKARCYRDTTHNYKYYGGVGVEICDEWLNSFEDFASWCIVQGYKKGMAISRFGDTGNYSPDNCKILTMSQNTREMLANNELTRSIILSKDKSIRMFDSIQDAARWLISEGVTISTNTVTVGSCISQALAGRASKAYGYKTNYVEIV